MIADFHSEVGMALLVKIGNVRDLPKEPAHWPQCGDFILSAAAQVRISLLAKLFALATLFVLYFPNAIFITIVGIN